MTDDVADQVAALFPLDGPYTPELTTGAAESIAGLMRYLNHATAPWKGGGCLEYPSHLASTVANLRGALYGAEQLLGQLAHHAGRFGEDPNLYDDHGDDPAVTVVKTVADLRYAAEQVIAVADTLGHAHEQANRLGVRDDGSAL